MGYRSLNQAMKERFGCKVYKLALDGGMTCPNRDGTIGTRGCIFCSAGGSGDFAADASLSITEQINSQIALLSAKRPIRKYIAYFQAYTNTYAPAEKLEKLFSEAISHPDIRILSIATRPDCLNDEILALLDRLNRKKPVWVELGLQTIHPESAAFIRRGYDLPVFEHALTGLRHAGIDVIVHVILGLPCESTQQMLQTVDYLNTRDIQGIKLQLLHILEYTDLADYYREHPFWIPTMDEYFHLLGECICHLRPDIVIHRLTGDGPKSLLIEPKWTGNKRNVLNQMQAYFKRQNIWQGRSCSYGRTTDTL